MLEKGVKHTITIIWPFMFFTNVVHCIDVNGDIAIALQNEIVLVIQVIHYSLSFDQCE